MTQAKKKLIEVALPLEAINIASAREKEVKVGKPNNLHLWWAPRPHAAARAVIFSQMVDDPSSLPDLFPTEKQQEKERDRLFRIIEQLVLWENTTNEKVVQAARDEIWASWRRACAENVEHPRATELFDRKVLPAFHDPFAGGGALPLEAQRLGLESYASDLNPVAVIINKAKLEIPPKFAGWAPVNPPAKNKLGGGMGSWKGAGGLADDLLYYGQWMRNEAEKRIGALYPKVAVTAEMAAERPDLSPYAGQELTVIAWLWARTVKSPNPAFAQVDVPLASTFMLSTKAGKEAYVEPVIERGGYRFTVKAGKPKDAERAKSGTKLSRGANFECLMSKTPIPSEHIYSEAKAGRMGARLIAIVAEGTRGRVYLAPTAQHEAAALGAKPQWKPEVEMPENPRWFSPPLYGLKTYGDLFTARQLVALTTFSDLVQESRELVERDALTAGLPDDRRPLRDGGTGATAYAEAVGVYLGLAVSRSADWTCTITRWLPHLDKAQQMFSRHAIPMGWDFTEINTVSKVGGSFVASVKNLVSSFERLPLGQIKIPSGFAFQKDAAADSTSTAYVCSTDPPYYDNIGYADLSDFFYVWLRRSLRPTFPELFATVTVPKAEELVATPHRHGSRENAESFFLDGMTLAMHQLAEQSHPAFPVTIYYAFKQSESESNEGTASTGWETFLDAVLRAGFSITGTWPIRTEKATRTISIASNALASSIVLVCRKREATAPTATRREFLAALQGELPVALSHLQQGNIAPVDLAQAAIGPGMAIYTRYARVLDAEGKPVSVREALTLINQVLDETLAEQEGDFDADSRWAVTWFEQFGFVDGDYGGAEQLSKSKNTSVSGMVTAGIIESKRGRVRLFKPSELPASWDPETDDRLVAWEVVHHLIRALESGGETAAAALVAKIGDGAETARDLAYRLYAICERKKRASEARSYNSLVQSFPEMTRLAKDLGLQSGETVQLFGNNMGE